MKAFRKGLLPIVVSLFSSIALFIFTFFPVNSVVGSHFSFFSVSDVLMPLIGNLGFGFISFVVASRLMLKMFLVGAPLTALVYYIPGAFASAYWATKNKLLGLVVPLACMVAFLAHPVGLAAAPYTFYWFIPMALYFVPRKSIFFHSLTSTFIAHSVGSVVWLYLHPMSPSAWMSLIPVVAAERFLFATSMTAVYCALSYLKNTIFGLDQKREAQTENIFL